MTFDIKGITEILLRDHGDARNSDMALFYRLFETVKPEVAKLFTMEEFMALPSLTSISRARRNFQADGDFLATEKVQKLRDSMEDDMREQYRH